MTDSTLVFHGDLDYYLNGYTDAEIETDAQTARHLADELRQR